ncbi:MAG: FecR family protein [Bacteroidota bacterium]
MSEIDSMQMDPERLFEKLINSEITREEFEALLDNLEDDQLRRKYDDYLQAQFMKELDDHFKTSEKPVEQERRDHLAKQESGKRNIRRFYTIAATLLIIASVSFYVSLFIPQFNGEGKQQLSKVEEGNPLVIQNTPNKRMFRTRLEDGSFVHLNAVSSISYPKHFSENKREVEISGEAYFDVQRDEQRPFSIKVKDYTIQVLGTSFNIKAYEDESNFSVTVESGSVNVRFNSGEIQPVILTKNQKLFYNQLDNTLEINTVNPDHEMSWRKGILRFNSTPLGEVEKMLERWYGVEVIIEDESIYEKSLTGVHQNENIRSVLESLTYATGTEYEIKNNKIIIKK